MATILLLASIWAILTTNPLIYSFTDSPINQFTNSPIHQFTNHNILQYALKDINASDTNHSTYQFPRSIIRFDAI